MNRSILRRALIPGVTALALTLTACGGSDDAAAGGASGEVIVDGSSTVFPLSDAAAEFLLEENDQISVNVSESGTGGGFERFCNDETDISNASRPIDEEEIAACEANGIEYVELQVATDALTMVVNKDLAVDCLTVDQIIQLWGPTSTVSNWSELDPSFPDQEIALFGPGTDSGTYDYLAGDVIGDESEETRSDYEASENDQVIVEGVANTPGGTGYFGYTYFEQNTDTLKALAIDNGSGCVEPSADTARDGSYTPLARPLFIYVNKAKYNDNAAVKEFVDFYIDNLPTIAETALFIPLNDEQTAATTSALESLAG